MNFNISKNIYTGNDRMCRPLQSADVITVPLFPPTTTPLYTVLMKLGDSKPALFGLALDALHKQISRLPVPYTRKQEEEDVHGLGRCCTALLTFVQPFVQEVKSQDAKSPVENTYHTRLNNVLLKL